MITRTLFSRRSARATALSSLLLSTFGAASLASAQEPLTPPVANGADWLAPIHGLGDDPLADQYGLWASGPHYKVQLGRSIAFFPLRGEAGENTPVRWTTRSITIGGEALVRDGSEARAEHGDWRYVLHHGAVDEIYDVRREGLEQSFVIHAKPAQPGDLVIEGELETTLVPEAQAPEHDAIELSLADGTPLVNYGKALAIDATGRTTPMLSSVVGRSIRLQLDGAWIAEASFPLTVDPLISSNIIATDPRVVRSVDLATDDENHMFFVARERIFAIGDNDLYSTVESANATTLSAGFSDVSNSWSTQHPSTAYIAGSNKWVLAFERIQSLSSTANVYAYVQEDGSVAPAGVVRALSVAAGTQHRFPVVGGVVGGATGSQALLAYQYDVSPTIAPTEESRIRGVFLDTNALSFGPSFALSIDSPGHDCERPAISRFVNGGFDSWLVVYQQWNAANANDDWDVLGLLVRTDGMLSNREIIAAALSGEHALWPKVDGSGGRFLVLHGAIANTQKSYGDTFPTLRAQRVDWEFFDPNPSFPHARRTMRNAAANLYGFGGASSRPIAYNRNSRSHWGLGWIESGRIARSVRVGYDAGIVEDAVLHQVAGESVASVSASYDQTTDAFAFAYGVVDPGGSNPVRKRDLQFANAFQLPYGASCGGDAIGRGPITGTDAPHAGSEFYFLSIDNAAAFAPSALLIAPLPGALPIGNGCTLLLDPATFFLVWSGATNAGGQINVPVSLPTTPIFEYDLYWQWLQIDPASGQPTLTNGLRTFIR
jgi:hypothetical protein